MYDRLTYYSKLLCYRYGDLSSKTRGFPVKIQPPSQAFLPAVSMRAEKIASAEAVLVLVKPAHGIRPVKEVDEKSKIS